MTAAADLADKVAARQGRVILTPHHGEMSKLAGISADEVENNPQVVAADVARTFNAVVALKGKRTIVMTPGGHCVRFEGGNNGLATSGSGDVLAGLVGGFAARGADPFTAAGWGVFVHGTAGERAATAVAPLGYLARELLPQVPAIVAEAS
jgi:ADP-dependent NAD(P)H-hydrate dehydratase